MKKQASSSRGQRPILPQQRPVSMLRDESGAALLIVLFLVMLLAIITADFVIRASTSHQISKNAFTELHAQYADESGVEFAKNVLLKDLKPDEKDENAPVGKNGRPQVFWPTCHGLQGRRSVLFVFGKSGAIGLSAARFTRLT